jgi:nucleoid DNA-binding protein
MNFDALCNKVSEKTGQKPGLVRKILEDSFDAISEALLTEPSVGAGRFGRFRLQNRGEGLSPRIVLAPRAQSAQSDEQDVSEEDETPGGIAFQPGKGV